MKNKKQPFAVLFAAVTLAALAPAANGAEPAPDPSAEKVVTVKLKFDAANPDRPVGIESVTPDPVELSLARKHFVRWVLSPAKSGALKIDLQDEGGKPFRKAPAAFGDLDQVVSGVPELGVEGKEYKYTVTVRVPGREKDLVLDPRIIVLP